MEIFFVYGLVVVFFILLIPVISFIMQDSLIQTHPEPLEKKTMFSLTKVSPEKTAAYGILAALFTFMCVLTVLVHRSKS